MIHKILILTMPGFGSRVLEELFDGNLVSSHHVHIGIIGSSKVGYLSRLRASIRKPLFSKGSYIQFRDPVLSQKYLATVLRRINISHECVTIDDDVQKLIYTYKPDLILTITSRIIFSAKTILSGNHLWLNVHPGILPKYAGAVPAPYMYRDSLGGSTIHVMTEKIDAGDIVDCSTFSGELGKNVGEYFFEFLPPFVAGRISIVLRQWEENTLAFTKQDPAKLEYCTNVRLTNDRIINWNMKSEDIATWIRSLYPLASARLRTPKGVTVEVENGVVLNMEKPSGNPGYVVAAKGCFCNIETLNGVICIETKTNPHLSAGDHLDSALGNISK